MADVRVTIPNINWQVSGDWVQFLPPTGSYIPLGNTLSSSTADRFLGQLQLNKATGQVVLNLANSQTQQSGFGGQDFSSAMETNGHIALQASNGDEIAIPMGSDTQEPYNWSPSNASAVATFATTLAGLSNRALEVILDDTGTAPSFNTPPTVSQITATDSTIASGEAISLTATASDPDMDALTYAWASDGGGTFSAADALTTDWTAPTVTDDTDIMLTLTVNDGTVDVIRNITISVSPEPVPLPGVPDNNSKYKLLVDFYDDETYELDIYPLVFALNFSAGATGAKRQRLRALRGSLRCSLHDRGELLSPAALENRLIRVRRDGLYQWGGRIDKVDEKKERSGQRDLIIHAVGNFTSIWGNVASDISTTGDTSASEAIEMLTGLSNLDPSSEVVTDWAVDAGDDILEQLRIIQDDSDTRVYEALDGSIQVTGQGIEELWDITLSEGETAGDKRARSLRRDTAKTSIINAVVIDGTKYTDSDSVDEYGEILHPGTFAFAKASEAATIAANIFSLYAAPANLYKFKFLLEELAGQTNQNDLLRLLHYGNGRVLKVRDEGEIKLAEIIKAGHVVHQDERHIIDLLLREREINDLTLTLCTYYDLDVGYFVALPPNSADGERAITGHRIQFREEGETGWTNYDSGETGLVANDTFAVPDENTNYDVRVIARSSAGNEQTSPTQTLKAFAGEPRKAAAPFGAGTMRQYRGIRMYNDNIRNHESITDGIFGYDMEVRNPDLPEGIGAPASLYETILMFAESLYNAYQVPTDIDDADNLYARAMPFYYSYPTQALSYFRRRMNVPLATTEWVGNATNQTGAECRFRPVFWDAVIGNDTSVALSSAPRGLWTPWITLDSMAEY